MKAHAEANGFSVVREFGGHGIGWDFHEDPFVSHVSEAGTGVVLAPGMMFTIEPMINAGESPIDMSDPNGWTVRTADGSDSAQWEIQVVVTEDGYELLSWLNVTNYRSFDTCKCCLRVVVLQLREGMKGGAVEVNSAHRVRLDCGVFVERHIVRVGR